MELRDYLVALRRYWTTWVAVAVVAVAVALAVVLGTTPTYEARATVFVASSSEDGQDGAQFIRQRVTSYPAVARSEAVLAPVISSTGLDASVPELRARVSADNPVESSQIDITVTDDDARRAASTANAIADEFRRAVEELETPLEGASPVNLTVTNPANVPADPTAPRTGLLLGLGLVVGLALGAAASVLRSRLDTRVHTEDDVRAAWGPDAGDLAVLGATPRRRRSSRLTGRPASLVARRLATAAGQSPVRAVVLGTAPADDRAARAFAEEVTGDLTEGGMPALVSGPVGQGPAASKPPAARVQLATATPDLPLAQWRRLAQEHDGVILVAESGRVDGADLREIRAILAASEARLLAVVLLPRRRPRTAAERRAGASSRRTMARENLSRARQRIALGER
jgi:capsular polysaccharide biosynthesis protein